MTSLAACYYARKLLLIETETGFNASSHFTMPSLITHQPYFEHSGSTIIVTSVQTAPSLRA